MNIIVAGIMGRYPYGGVAWCSLMYLLGLRQLGHRVWYLEDMAECNFDPVENTLSKDPLYALNFIASCLEPYGLGERWCYIDWKQEYHGYTRERWLDVCAGADLFINLSGGSWLWRDEYARIPHSAFIDTDPGFTQINAASHAPERIDFLERYSALFTFGRNIGTTACPLDTSPLQWHHTWQPVCMDEWQSGIATPSGAFTTIMTWKIESFAQIGGNKDIEMLKFLDLPVRSPVPLELAVNGPKDLLRQHGWRCRDAFEVSHSLDAYRDYVAASAGEFSVAKHTYVRLNTGWFSDRTECYLASGRPAVVQDTGFSAHLPTGEGLFAYTTAEEAQAALEKATGSYSAHCRAARELAEAHFAAEAVLPPLLEQATSRASIQAG